MRSAVPLTALAVAAVLLLGGCVPGDAQVAPPPAQTTEPIFASDEEALAAATEAYEAYLAMSDLIAQEGGKDPERIAPYVTKEWLKQEMKGNKELADSGRVLVGNFRVTQTTLQQMFVDESALVNIVIYACVSPSGARLLGPSGKDVTPPELKAAWPTEATFSATDPTSLLLMRDEPWPTDSYC